MVDQCAAAFDENGSTFELHRFLKVNVETVFVGHKLCRKEYLRCTLRVVVCLTCGGITGTSFFNRVLPALLHPDRKSVVSVGRRCWRSCIFMLCSIPRTRAPLGRRSLPLGGDVHLYRHSCWHLLQTHYHRATHPLRPAARAIWVLVLPSRRTATDPITPVFNRTTSLRRSSMRRSRRTAKTGSGIWRHRPSMPGCVGAGGKPGRLTVNGCCVSLPQRSRVGA